MTLFITSDTHFFHEKILVLGEGRPFATIEEHNETLVENWNRIVKPEDTVIHLGDVVFGQRRETLPIVGRLNGYKILIPGNHDHVSSLHKKRDDWLPVYGEYFDEIWPETVRLWPSTFLSHYPPAEIADHGEEDRYPHLRPILVKNGLYLHGHTHQSDVVTELSNGSIAVNVGVDANNWTPVEVATIPGIKPSQVTAIAALAHANKPMEEFAETV